MQSLIKRCGAIDIKRTTTMIRKLIAIILAIAINCGVLATLNHLSTVSVASAAPPATQAQRIVTLPTIRVTPTRAQMEQLRGTAAPHAPAAASSTTPPAGNVGMQALVMPYYSFADQSDVGRNG
jgi:hypothetical protein